MATTTIDTPESVKLDRANIVGVRYAYDGKDIYIHADHSGTGVYVDYTVPANRLLLLFNWSSRVVTADANVASQNCEIIDNALNTLYRLSWYDRNVAYDSQFLHGESSLPFELPGGYAIRTTLSGANIYGSFSGYGILMEI